MKKTIIVGVLLVAFCSLGYSETNEELFAKWRDDGIENVMAGNLKEAQVCFEAALTFKPNDAEVKKALAMIEQRLNPPKSTTVPVAPTTKISRWEPFREDMFIRVSVGTAPGIDEFEDVSISEGDGAKLEIMVVQGGWDYVHPNIGWIFGGGLLFISHDGELNSVFGDAEFDVRAVAFLMELGGVLKISEHIILEAKPFFGVGSAKQEVTTSFGGSDDDTGYYYCYGAKGGAYVFFGKNVELGLEVGLHSFYANTGSGEYSSGMKMSGDGLSVSGSFSIKF